MVSLSTLLWLAQHLTLTLAGVTARQTNTTDVLDWIDPLIGSENGGNVFAGATLPYGMAKGPPYRPNAHSLPLLTHQ
jgi:putative alpha-1,2-mannosidase